MSLHKAQEFKNKKKYREALNELEILAKKDPKNQQVWQEKSFCENKLELYQNSISSCEYLIKINPKNEVAWNNQAFALTKLSRTKEALESVDNCLKIKPNYEYAHNTKALAFFNLEKYEEGLQCAEQAIKINQTFLQAWNNKGFALCNLAKYKDAVQWLFIHDILLKFSYDHVLTYDKQHLVAWCNKGDAMNMMGQQSQALKCAEEALKLQPRSANAWNCKGQILSSLNNNQEALLCFEKALLIDANYKRAKINLQKIQADYFFLQILSEKAQQSITNDFMEDLLQENLKFWVGKLTNLYQTNPTYFSLYFKYLQPFIMKQNEVSEFKITEPKIQTTSTAMIHYGIYKNQPVAIKEISIQDENDPKLSQLLHENAILAFCQHKNIATLKSIYFNQKQMEIQILQEKYFMDFEQALFGKQSAKVQNKKQLILQILDAIIHIHSMGLTHDDLKLSNIMFKAADLKDIVLLHFGTSKINEISRKLPVIPQSYFYCPPEVTESEHIHILQKSDMFSFGIILYEIVSGKRAWQKYANKPFQVYELIQKKAFNFFSENNSSGVNEINNLVKSCLQMDQNQRPTAEEAKIIIEKTKF